MGLQMVDAFSQLVLTPAWTILTAGLCPLPFWPIPLPTVDSGMSSALTAPGLASPYACHVLSPTPLLSLTFSSSLWQNRVLNTKSV